MKTILINKPRSMTPFQAITRLKELRPELENEKISYAGRLDPMAKGLLILLVGDENKKRHSYEDLPKTYEFSVLFGVNTDSYDVLGKILESKSPPNTIQEQVTQIISSYLGERSQEYPPYSSQTIDGKPMYYLARNDLLKGKVIPTKNIFIKDLSILRSELVSAEILAQSIVADIENVDGDFRQKDIIVDWETWSKKHNRLSYPLITFRAIVTSGAYIRSLVNEFGKDLGIPALAYSIIRTSIGDFNLSDAIAL